VVSKSEPICPATGSGQSSGFRVLYMEDDPGLARLVQKRLERAGYIVDLARDGEEGLAMYAAGSYDVVAVDQSMPVHNGLEVIRILASRGSLPLTIMVTGSGDEKIAAEAMKLGARDYIVKDVDGRYLDLLPAVIEQVLQQQRLVEEKQQVEEALERRLEQLVSLNQASQTVTSSLELDQVLAEIVSLAGEVVASDYAGVVLVDEEGKLGRSVEYLPGVPDIERRIRAEGFTHWIVRSRQAVVVDDVNEDGTVNPRPANGQSPELVEGAPCMANPLVVEAGVKSFVGLPLLAQDRLLGVFYLHSLRPGNFRDQLPLLTTFANQAAIAIENARLYQAERKRATQLAVVNQVARQAASILDLDQLLQETATAIQQSFNYHNVALSLLDEAASELEVLAIAGGFADVATPGYRQAVGEGMTGWTAKAGQSLLVNDVGQEPRYVPGFLEEPLTKSELCVPLKLAGKVIGVLDVQETQLNAFDETDLLAMETLADQIAVAIESAQLFGETKRRFEETTALYQTSLDITAQLGMTELLKSIVERAVTLLRAETGSIYLYDLEREELSLAIGYDYTEKYVGTTLKPGEGMAGKVIQTGEPLIVDDYRTWEGRAAVYEADQPFTAVLEVPLKWRERIIGVLAINADAQTRTFDQDDVWLATLFANQAAVAIENARLYERITERMVEATVLHRVSNILMRTLNLEQLLEDILEVLQRSLGYSHCAILLPDGGTEELYIKVARGYLQATGEGLRIKIGQEGITGWVAASGVPLNVPDVTKDERYVEGVKGTRSEIAVPMLVGEQVVGVLDVQSTEVNAFGEDDLRTLSSVAAQAAIAIERARLFQEARRRSREQATLFQASAAVLSTLHVGEVLYEVARQTTLAIDTTSARVCQWNEAERTVTVIAEYITPQASQKELVSDLGTVYPVKDSRVFQSLRDRQPLTVRLTDPEISEAVRNRLEEFGGNTLLYLPLAVREQVIGYVEVWESRRKRHFTQEEIDLCQAIGNQAAIAIENARLFAAGESSRQKVEAVIQKMTDGLLIIDASCDIILANQRAAELLDAVAGDLAGQNLLAVCPYSSLNALVREALGRSPHITRGEIGIEETGRYDLGVTVALFIQDSEQVLWYVLLHDITHLKELDRMKSDFVSNVSHDLRTPLANIKLYAALAQKGRPEKRKHYLTTIESETERLETLIEDILDLSRLERGVVELQMEPLPLAEIVQQVVGAHLAAAQAKGIELTWQVPDGLPTLHADRNQLLLMLNNLLGNALQYTPRGGSARVDAQAGEWRGQPALHIAVCDTGIGIPADEQERIFERFYRGRRTLADTTGTGLGLAIVKEGMALHGGQVMVESAVGRGSAFTLCFPLKRR
jgi:GAF domain-containing protein/ActR/RegA family two-component response regulator